MDFLLSSSSTKAFPHQSQLISIVFLPSTPFSLSKLVSHLVFLLPTTFCCPLCSDEEGEITSQDDFIKTVWDIIKEGEEVESMANMVANDCTEDRIKTVCLQLLHPKS